MRYLFTVIADSEVPRASNPLFQHLVDTYASETNKVTSVWHCFDPSDLDFRPHPKSSTVADILKHQLLSERRFFGEFVGTPEPPPAEVLPASLELDALHQAHGRAGSTSPEILRRPNSRVVDGRRPLLRTHAPTHLGVLEARSAHLPSPHSAHRLSSNAE